MILTTQERRCIKAYTVTMQLYQEKKSKLGLDKLRPDLGFSTGHIVKVCDADYVADVENIATKATKDAPVLERIYVVDDLECEHSWIWSKTTSKEFRTIQRRAQIRVGADFLEFGIHPYALYSKPVDVR